TWHLRLPGNRADGHRSRAPRRHSDRGARLLGVRDARCARRDTRADSLHLAGIRAVIQIESLSKQYGATTVVDQVSFNIERNSIAVIVGTSGSGKSTLSQRMTRLVEPTHGR